MGKVVQKFKVDGKEIIFRQPQAKDAADIVKLVGSFVAEKAMVGENKKPVLKEIKAMLLKRLKQIKKKEVVYLVVEVGGKVKGRAWVNIKDRDAQSHRGNLVIHLSCEIRGKGLGDKLLKAIIKEAKKTLKLKMITLEVMVANKSAINLYKKNGFKEYGRLNKGLKHHGKLMDGILMVKYL